MTTTIERKLQQQNLVNFFKPFHPQVAHFPMFVGGLLSYILYAMIYKKWELLDDNSPYTRLHLQTFCLHTGLSERIVRYHLKKLASCENPWIKQKSYYKSTYIAFTDNVIDCLQRKTVTTHLRYAFNNHYRKNKEIAYVAHPLFLQWKELFSIQKKRSGMMKKLIDTDIDKKPDTWATGIVKEICKTAAEKEAVLNGSVLFPHLDANGELKMTKKIDAACRHLQSMHDGTFLRQPNLFGKLNENILDIKRTKEAVVKLKSCAGDSKKIRAFVLRCAHNYFEACEQGMDCIQSLKTHWPVSIDEFFMKTFYRTGDHIAYFLLHRFEPETTEMGEAIALMENCGLPDSVIDRFNDFGNAHVAGYSNSIGVNTKKYWLNIKTLISEFHTLKKAGKTSYSIWSYFDFILEEVQKQATYYGEVYPDAFSLSANTVRQAMKIIKDK